VVLEYELEKFRWEKESISDNFHFSAFSPAGLPQVPNFCDPVQKDFKAKVLLFPFFTSPLLRDASTIEKKIETSAGTRN
jgi:hypothetical protein